MYTFEPETIRERQSRVAQALGPDAPVLLIGAGVPIPKPGGHDQTFPFVPYPEYYWLTGLIRPGGILAYDPGEGWTHFVHPVSEDERLWEGGGTLREGVDIAGFREWLDDRRDRPVASLGAPVEGVEGDSMISERVRGQLEAERRRKDRAEMDLLQRAVSATAAGYARAREVIRPGVTERYIQIELEAEFFRNGAERTGFDTIVGAGINAAVLHFTPGDRIVGPDDLVLIDSGAEIRGYTADVTRTFPAGDAFTAEQQAIYDIVLAAQHEAIALCKPGVEWHDVHLSAARVLAQGLRDLGILKGNLDELVESEAISLFFPHGIGHMVGLGVRDVGGRAPGREENRYAGARIRVDLPLQEQFLMTVEPGIYFVEALLDAPQRRERFQNQVNWDVLDRWRPVGGVRIEDNILITNSGPQVITAEIPK